MQPFCEISCQVMAWKCMPQALAESCPSYTSHTICMACLTWWKCQIVVQLPSSHHRLSYRVLGSFDESLLLAYWSLVWKCKAQGLVSIAHARVFFVFRWLIPSLINNCTRPSSFSLLGMRIIGLQPPDLWCGYWFCCFYQKDDLCFSV